MAQLQVNKHTEKQLWKTYDKEENSQEIKKLKRLSFLKLFLPPHKESLLQCKPTENKQRPRDNKVRFQTVSLNHLVQLCLKLEIPPLDFLVT